MLYQSILTHSSPYSAWIRDANTHFPAHKHADIELHYCISGSFRILLEKKEYTVSEGELLFVSPLVSHELPEQKDARGEVLTVVLGFFFLEKSFSYFSRLLPESPLLSVDTTPTSRKLFSLLEEISRACKEKEPAAELLIRGNLYSAFYCLSSLLLPACEPKQEGFRLPHLKSIDRALELIHSNYSSPLSVDHAAAVTGYSKSNFCKVFKEVTGDTFHNALNKHRIEVATGLLRTSDLSASQISDVVGFSEPKAFCRIFKSIIGTSPGIYRKSAPKNGT